MRFGIFSLFFLAAVRLNVGLAQDPTHYKTLGIDPHSTLPDQQDRPIHILPFGEPIRELI